MTELRRARPAALSRRMLMAAGTAGVAAPVVGFRHSATARQATPVATPRAPEDRAAEIVDLVRVAMTQYALRAAIVRVTVDGAEVVTEAFGESMTGVPASTDMHFRNGNVAFAYMATLLLQMVDEGAVGLDDPIATWMPELPHAEAVTLRMLANMTTGYFDYVQDDGFLNAFYADPFQQWTADELMAIGLGRPQMFEPGTNWGYSHTNYVILGRALEMIAGQPLASLLEQYILNPLGLRDTRSSSTAAIPAPVLHTFTSERRWVYGVDPGTRFYEEATFWNPSWTTAPGAVQTTTIHDLTATAEAVGTGALLSAASHRAQVSPELIGFGSPEEGCPTCRELTERYSYGIGVALIGPWILQSPLFAGCGGVMAYLPSKRIAIGIATTFGEESYDDEGLLVNGNAAQAIFRDIAAYLAPDDALPA